MVLIKDLRHFINDDQRNWDKFLKIAYFAYNTSMHTSTKFQPFELTMGRKITIPSSFKGREDQVLGPFYAEGDYVAEIKNNLEKVSELRETT